MHLINVFKLLFTIEYVDREFESYPVLTEICESLPPGPFESLVAVLKPISHRIE